MDPFSITVGAVALAETATKLASFLTDRYRAYSSAPKEMIEIASQVTMCAGLVDVFARSVDSSEAPFPKSFQRDASALVLRCRTILKDIEETVPHGSKKPDYADKLKYAFSSQKKILKHQENLNQVQHMFMFMTTCWQYQLPSQQSKQPISATGSAIPIGSLQGTLQHVPIQINMQNPNNTAQTITYEATLTLKQMEQPILVEAEEKEKFRKEQEIASRKSKLSSSRAFESSSREKQMLANMRRSPYFSMNLLKPTVLAESRSYDRSRMSAREEEEFIKREKEELIMKEKYMKEKEEQMNKDRMERTEKILRSGMSAREKEELMIREKEELIRKEEEAKMRMEEVSRSKMPEAKGSAEIRVTPPSKEQASKEVDDLLSLWFQEDSEPEADPYDSLSEPEEEEAVVNTTPLTKGVLDVDVLDVPFRPSASPTPKPIEWDWRCDACKKEVRPIC